jgi:hypothetical protein
VRRHCHRSTESPPLGPSATLTLKWLTGSSSLLSGQHCQSAWARQGRNSHVADHHHHRRGAAVPLL